MSLIGAEAMFKIFPAKVVHRQKVKLRPNEHYYENGKGEVSIKYSCQICDKLSKSMKDFYSKNYDKDEKFVEFSFPKGTEQCPCCGANIDWDYKGK